LTFLLNLADKEGIKGSVIFPTDDETVFFLSKHRHELSGLYGVTTPEWDVIKYAYNKKHSYQLAEKLNISIPLTFYPKNVEDLKKVNIPFPVIIKPAVMRDFFRKTGKKVFLARNYDELLSLYQKALTIIGQDEILIQEKIPDVANHLYSFCPFFKQKRVLARIIAKRSRQHPMDFGQASTFAETINIPQLESIGKRILSFMNYYGLCEVEFIQDPRDGIFKFLEINPRIWGWHTLALRAGVNLPYLLYQDMTGKELISQHFKEGVKWIRFMTDIPTVIQEIVKRRMKLKDYIYSLKGEKEYAVFSLKDPLPFLGELLILPYLLKKRGF
jgi:predicted ATP-grasp superfamily ATP-dependent carboligase